MSEEPEKSLYARIVEAGIPHDHHASDLYFKATPESLAILRDYGKKHAVSWNNFRNQADGTAWIDAAFHYDPFWESVARKTEVAAQPVALESVSTVNVPTGRAATVRYVRVYSVSQGWARVGGPYKTRAEAEQAFREIAARAKRRTTIDIEEVTGDKDASPRQAP